MSVLRQSERVSVRPRHRDTNVYSHFLASFGAQDKTNCTSMLWSIDSCKNRVSADQYHLTVPRGQVSSHWGRGICWQITSFKWSQAQFCFFFPMIHIRYVVFMSLWPRTIRILISNWSRTRKFSQFFQNFLSNLFLPWSPISHALRPILMLWLVKIWQVSSYEKFMQHLESCLLWQLRLTEFSVNLWCFWLSFSSGCTKWNTAVYCVFGWEMRKVK